MHLLKTRIGRLRIIGFLEGLSLLFLIFIAVPMKYIYDNTSLVRAIGPVHGILFLLFVFNAIGAGIEQRWKFKTITWKVLLACLVPFGTFYIDRKILRNVEC
jgi:integral membrane protein